MEVPSKGGKRKERRDGKPNFEQERAKDCPGYCDASKGGKRGKASLE